MWTNINKDYDMMTQTLPEDKKDFVKKEVKAVGEKLPVVERFHEKVQKIETFVARLNEFDKNLKFIDGWMLGAEGNLNDVKNHSDQMTPEDRVSHTMELQEDVAAKVQLIKKCIAEELDLLPQGILNAKTPCVYKINYFILVFKILSFTLKLFIY